jgi:DNA polymerase-3 subunit beta
VREEKEAVFQFSKTEKVVAVRSGENEFYTRLIEGEYPPFEKVIPQEIKTKAVLDREELLRNIKIASVFAREFSNIIIFEFEKDGLRLVPKTDSAAENEAFQEADITGESQKVALNSKFVLDALNNLDSKNITIEVLRPDAPVVFKIEDKKNFLHIIMPIRIQH